MSAKTRTAWFCTECGAEATKWEGRCPSCGEWNTLVEESVTVSPRHNPRALMLEGGGRQSVPIAVPEIEGGEEERLQLPGSELNRVLGGGLVKGSLVLIGGEPGIGKSTLVLQSTLSIRSRRVLYVTGEESAKQLKMRAARIGRADNENVLILCETSLESIFKHIESVEPGIVVIDSIQTIASDALESAPGSVGQVRECAARLLRYAKASGVPVLMIGHITKEGSIAGPKVLEHIVDAVLQFEGDSQYMYRILRGVKNRFGSTSEIGIYEMCQRGLREVTNPSEMLLTGADEGLSGIATGVTVEGIRPLLVEAQALVSTAAYGTPQRAVTGYDPRRLNMLLAVLEKRVGFKLAKKDVFLNIAGGLRVNDPGLDMAVVAAILSSNFQKAVPRTTVMAGEVGLSGEVRPVTRMEQRVAEAAKLGLERIIIPRGAMKGIDTSRLETQVTEVSRVDELCRLLLAE